MATPLRPLRRSVVNSSAAIASCKRLKHTAADSQPHRFHSTYTPIHSLDSVESTLEKSTTPLVKSNRIRNTSSLSVLPVSNIIRSIAILTVSSSSWLLRPSMVLMDKMAHPSSYFLDPDRNPLLRRLIKKTVYAQFCAGENRQEVQSTVNQLRQLGYKGVVLAFAKENDVDKSATKNCTPEELVETAEAQKQIEDWSKGNLETVRLATQGDFAALKFTGAGTFVLKILAQNLPPTPSMQKAIDDICDLASARNVRLLFDAEHQAVQAGIDSWTLNAMKKYNCRGKGATVYGTYQAYLKATPRILAEHMTAARDAGFVLGVKLVRGAYLGSDPRNLINDTKEDTDRQYDGIAASLLQGSYNKMLKCSSEASAASGSEYPDVNVVLASHNEQSVRLAQNIRTAQARQSKPRINLVYAQLMGMADEVSCELLRAGQVCTKEKAVDIPLAYKYLVWGTTGECMKYLLRRAHENGDAVSRTRVGRDLMLQELWRRAKRSLGFS